MFVDMYVYTAFTLTNILIYVLYKCRYIYIYIRMYGIMSYV